MKGENVRKIKYSVSVLIFLLVFILNSELYQNYFQIFTEQFYFYNVILKDNKNGICNVLTDSTEKNNAGVFCVLKTTDSVFSSKIELYADDLTRELLESKYYIKEGIYDSFFSGKTNIVYKEFADVEKDFNEVKFYFIGDMEQARAIRNETYAVYGGGYIHKEADVGLEWLIWAIFGIAIGVLLVLTWVDIQFQKKENFIQLSLGASARKIVLKNILLDSIFFSAIFLSLRMIISKFVALDYAGKESYIIFGIFLFLNMILHLQGLFYDYKEVLYGANISLKTISNSYILKSITMMITIISLAVFIGLIAENYEYFVMYDEIQKYEDYYFLSIEKEGEDTLNGMGGHSSAEDARNQIFYEYQDKVALCVYNTVNHNGNKYFVVNENTTGIRELLSENKVEGFQGYYVLMPKGISDSEEIAKDAHMITSEGFEGFLESMPYKIIYYDEFELLYFDTATSSDLKFGFGKEKNPIMICCMFEKENISNNSVNCSYLDRTAHDIMYRINEADVNDMIKKYELANVTITKVTERCQQYRQPVMRLLWLNSVLFVFMLILEMVIIVTIVRMEYMVKAKELAIKSVLGYTVWQRNMPLLLLNSLSAILATVIMVIVSLMFDIATWYYTLIAGAILLMIESILMYYRILKTTQISVPKILKGGSL